jgi:multisubunit Na+/H+ antiporter MnhB subunit
MNDTLISGRRGQALAVALTIAMLGSLWVAVVGPLIGLYAGQTLRLTEERRLAAHMAAVAATVPALLRQAARLESSAQAAHAIALAAPSDAVAGAIVQQRMLDLAGTTGITLTSVETLPVQQTGRYRSISLRMTCATSWPRFIALLQALEETRPRLLIDDLDLEVSPGVAFSDGVMIAVSFTVIAFRPGAVL